MSILRPATPGFVVTLAATICLVLVSFSVPWFKAIYFLKATMQQGNFSGAVTFGVLGYCFETSGQVVCSKASVGYEFDPQALFGIDLPLNINVPSVAVKWLTYILVLHIVGLGFAALAALFGLLAHVRELSMTTLSSCSSGIAASIVLIAFIFDLIFFFIAKSRINAVGGSAVIGNGLWLTLASWIMLFFSGCFYGFGRCCIQKRPRGPKGTKTDKGSNVEQGGGYTAGGGNFALSNADAMRMEAIRAENERKARQAEQGLPAFPTQAEAVPLRKNSSQQYYYETDSEDDNQFRQPYRDNHRPGTEGPRRQGTGHTARRQGSTDTNITTNYAGRGRHPATPGYVPLPAGRNPVDPYNNNSSASNIPPAFPSSPPLPNVYPPQTHYPQPSYATSASPPPMSVPMGGVTQQSQFLSPESAGAGAGQVYGHGLQQSSYHSAISHQPGYSSYDPYGSTNPYTAAGVGRPPGDSLYYPAQNLPGLPTHTPTPPTPSMYSNSPAPTIPQTQSPPPPPPLPHPQTQQSYNPYAGYTDQRTQSPTRYASPEQGHVAAPWQQAAVAPPAPPDPPQQTTNVPSEAPPGYEYGMPGAFR